MQAREIAKRDLHLAVEELHDEIRIGGHGHIPLGDVPDAFGSGEKRRGHQGDVAETGPIEVGDDGAVGAAE